MNYFKKIYFFSLFDKIKIIKYTIGSILADSIPKGLKHTYHLLQDLNNKGVKVTRRKDYVEFKNPTTGLLVTLEQNSSDSRVYEQILQFDEYKNVLELVSKYKIPIHTMIDAGANVGFTSMYFKSQFNDLRVIALEPSLNVFNKLKRNITINKLTNIVLLQKGLWSKTTRLKADRTFRDGEDWSFRIVEASENELADIETYSISDLIEKYQLDIIDFLKMDIEGGEKAVFEGDVSWLNQVRIIAIEIHDEFDCREHIENTLIDKGFELTHSGELTIAVNTEIVKVNEKS
jgi:FkbM family methyltransferase